MIRTYNFNHITKKFIQKFFNNNSNKKRLHTIIYLIIKDYIVIYYLYSIKKTNLIGWGKKKNVTKDNDTHLNAWYYNIYYFTLLTLLIKVFWMILSFTMAR